MSSSSSNRNLSRVPAADKNASKAGVSKGGVGGNAANNKGYQNQNKNQSQSQSQSQSNAKKSRPRERPVSKFEDLIMHGVKPWDSDADEFYDALVQGRIELDRDLDAMDAQYAQNSR